MSEPKFAPMPTIPPETEADRRNSAFVSARLGYVSPSYHADVVARLTAENATLRERVRFHAINIEPFDSGRGEGTWIGCHECNSAWPEGDPEGHENGCLAAPETSADE